MKGLQTVIFLTISNTFMTLAWYGHLKFKDFSWGKNLSLLTVILISWGLAFFEYLFQVPANEKGYKDNGGPFTLVQLKTIQEAITLTVFMVFTLIFFKDEKLGWNHFAGFSLIVVAVFLIFKKW
ncbi:MAG: DMT family protein [Chitinophagaceae bacterium]|nr:DMT family protein [Chitinophagaceae bacterium]